MLQERCRDLESGFNAMKQENEDLRKENAKVAQQMGQFEVRLTLLGQGLRDVHCSLPAKGLYSFSHDPCLLLKCPRFIHNLQEELSD